MTFEALISRAQSVLNPRKIARNAEAGGVAAALLTDKGNVHTGVCIDTACGMGFCAEHAAVAAMVTAGESRIVKAVAVGTRGVMPPCGRCREFMSQIDDKNRSAEVMVSADTIVTLDALLPFDWASV
ncbi:MAG: cytidine deaminase [Clostridia bacterium]|nr:cytidine deaminase [Clostridia bacterium]